MSYFNALQASQVNFSGEIFKKANEYLLNSLPWSELCLAESRR